MAVSSLVSFNTYALETESISNVIEKLFSDGAVLSIFILFALCLTGYLVYGLYRFRQYQGQITESEERLRLSLWASGDEMWDWNIHRGSLHRTNGAGTYPLPNIDPSDFPPNRPHIHPQDVEKVVEKLKLHLNGEVNEFECVYRIKGSNDKWRWILDKGKVVSSNAAGYPIRMTGAFKDIHQIKKTESNLEIFARSIQSLTDGVVILNSDFNVIHINPGYTQITSFSSSDLIGKKLNFNSISPSLITDIKSAVDKTGNWQGDVTGQGKDGNMFIAFVTVNCIRNDENAITNYVAVVSDTTMRKKAEAKLIKMARTDTLTGLPNRNVFFSRLQKCVDKQLETAILVFDVDDFKKINDSLGHVLGDILLVKISERLKPLTNSQCILYRLGGDEFAITMEGTNDIHKVTILAKELLRLLSNPFRIEQHEFVVAASIGIVLYPDDGQQPETLHRNADTAMYHAKEKGNRYLFFNKEMNKQAVKRLQVENLIRQGLKEDYFHVYYQPKMSFSTGKLVGMEALVRFISPSGTLVSPGTFIPISEETGQVVEIGEVVLRKACADMKRWIDSGLMSGRVAVNLSARQFNLPNLIHRIESILLETGLSPNNLELEITEGTVMDDPQHAIQVMHELRALGIQLAMDDFGTGYSSLSYLRKFPLNTLKIDKAFVDDAGTSVGRAMIDTIITIARNLSLSTVAEGVETSTQEKLMAEMGCDVLQGYLYSKPLSSKELAHFAANQQPVLKKAQ